jgi:hypothetical protein
MYWEMHDFLAEIPELLYHTLIIVGGQFALK